MRAPVAHSPTAPGLTPMLYLSRSHRADMSPPLGCGVCSNWWRPAHSRCPIHTSLLYFLWRAASLMGRGCPCPWRARWGEMARWEQEMQQVQMLEGRGLCSGPRAQAALSSHSPWSPIGHSCPAPDMPTRNAPPAQPSLGLSPSP